MNIVIVTGGSRGLGFALVDQFCTSDYKVISISRTTADYKHPNLIQQIEFDLNDLSHIDKVYDSIKKCLTDLEPHTITLINNAGRLGNIAKVENCTANELQQTIQLNLSVPVILSSWVIRQFCPDHTVQILNISSGAAFNPYSGWTAYCASKAGLESMTKNIALEQSANPNFRILSISPGVIDTEMQQQIRNTSKEDFELVERFIGLHGDHLLSKPEDLAAKILFVAENDRFKSGETVLLKEIVLEVRH